MFHDPIITAAIIDRITYRLHVINMNGNSYRIKETREFIANSREAKCKKFNCRSVKNSLAISSLFKYDQLSPCSSIFRII